MRTSNKILIGLLLFTMLSFAFPVLWVKARVSSGHLVQRKADDINYDYLMSFNINEPVTKVQFNSLGNINILRSDTLRLEVNKSDTGTIRYFIQNGILTVQPKEDQVAGREYIFVKLYLPASVDTIMLANSRLELRVPNDSISHNTVYNIMAHFSEVVPSGREEEVDGNKRRPYFEALNVTAFNSKIEFNGRMDINKGFFKLNDSDFQDGHGVKYGQLKIEADSAANVSIKGNHVANTTITPIK